MGCNDNDLKSSDLCHLILSIVSKNIVTQKLFIHCPALEAVLSGNLVCFLGVTLPKFILPFLFEPSGLPCLLFSFDSETWNNIHA